MESKGCVSVPEGLMVVEVLVCLKADGRRNMWQLVEGVFKMHSLQKAKKNIHTLYALG